MHGKVGGSLTFPFNAAGVSIPCVLHFGVEPHIPLELLHVAQHHCHHPLGQWLGVALKTHTSLRDYQRLDFPQTAAVAA